MRSMGLCLIGLVWGLAWGACGEDAATPAVDAGAEVATDTAPGVLADIAQDVPNDVAQDVALGDVGPDATTPDGGGGDQSIPIQAIQDPAHAQHPDVDAPVFVTDVVVTTPRSSGGFWVGEPEGGPWSGVLVYAPPGVVVPALEVGDLVSIVGTYEEYYEESEIVATTVTLLGAGVLPEPVDVTTAQLCPTCPETEPYEGVLVRLTNIEVSNISLGYGEIGVQPIGGGPEAVVDDLFVGADDGALLSVGDQFSAVTGVLDFSYGAYKMAPRGCEDAVAIGGGTLCERPPCAEGPITVQQIQDPAHAAAAADRCKGLVEGLVATTPSFDNGPGSVFWAQDPAGGPHGGMPIVTLAKATVASGDVVDVTGVVTPWFAGRFLGNATVETVGTAPPPEPVLLTLDEVGDEGSTGVAYDGTLVEIADLVTVQSPAFPLSGVDDRAFWVEPLGGGTARLIVDTGLAAGFACPWTLPGDPCAEDQRRVGQRFTSIVGILDLNSRFALLPRDLDDLSLATCAAPDADCDDIADGVDVCPAVLDPAQANSDGDGVGDACDLCPAVDDPDQLDGDGDGIGDLYDVCPAVADNGQADQDGDGLGDACDADADGDGVDDAPGTDTCPLTANADQTDSDGDGVGDACEPTLHPIMLDGLFEDWADVPLTHRDPLGDDGPGGLDFGRLWITSDGERVFIRFETGREILLQDYPWLTLAFDTDDDVTTGDPSAGLGIDLAWRPGELAGDQFINGTSTPIEHEDIDFEGLPTVSATMFEVSLPVSTFPTGAFRMGLSNTASGDQLPDGDGGVRFAISTDTPLAPPAVDLGREQGTDLRIATYNVLAGGAFDPAKADRFSRQLAAVDPDLVAFQETQYHTAEENQALLEGWLGGTWHAATTSDGVISSPGNSLISRWPILHASPVAEARALMALVDSTASLGTPLLVVVFHPPCCGNITGRWFAVDQLLAAIRDAKVDAAWGIAAATPIVIAGDFNMVGPQMTLQRLLDGDIINEAIWGPDEAVDWDGSPLVVLTSSQTGRRSAATHPGGMFWGGILDYITYTGSVLEVGNHAIVDTLEMTTEDLTSYGLQATDSEVSDHLLRFADFR